MCRLTDASVRGGVLTLTFGATTYRELTGTNLSSLEWIRARHPDRLDDFLSNGTGVCCAIVTRDGSLVVQRRSRRVAHPGATHVPDGHIDPSTTNHAIDGAPHPFAAMIDELSDPNELALREPSAIAGLVCLGVVRDPGTMKPEIVFHASFDLDAPTVIGDAHTRRPFAAQYEELLTVRDPPDDVAAFLLAHRDQLVPVGAACLLRHGRRTFGERRFTALSHV